jgi:hypothetical protein
VIVASAPEFAALKLGSKHLEFKGVACENVLALVVAEEHPVIRHSRIVEYLLVEV